MEQSKFGKAFSAPWQHGKCLLFIVLADMHLVLGQCNGDAADAGRRYRQKYANRRLQNRCTFLSVDRRLQEIGTVQGMRRDAYRPSFVLHVRMEE